MKQRKGFMMISTCSTAGKARKFRRSGRSSIDGLSSKPLNGAERWYEDTQAAVLRAYPKNPFRALKFKNSDEFSDRELMS